MALALGGRHHYAVDWSGPYPGALTCSCLEPLILSEWVRKRGNGRDMGRARAVAAAFGAGAEAILDLAQRGPRGVEREAWAASCS